MKHFPQPTTTTRASFADTLDALTLDQMRAYMSQFHHLRHEDPARFMATPHMCFRAAAMAYAGENPMLHHARAVTGYGDHGAAQLFASFGSVGTAKYRACAWITEARQLIALGYNGAAVAGALENAARYRRAAFGRGVAA